MVETKLTLDEVAQFDSKLQLAVLSATAHVYASALRASGSTNEESQRVHARGSVDDYLQLIAPLIEGSRV